MMMITHTFIDKIKVWMFWIKEYYFLSKRFRSDFMDVLLSDEKWLINGWRYINSFLFLFVLAINLLDHFL